MSKIHFTPVSDEDLARIERATLARDAREPRIEAARYEASSGRLMLEMRGGATVGAAARGLRGLSDASDEQIAAVRVVSNGSALHWDELDVQMTTLALLQDVLRIRTVQDAARRAGQTSSEAKALAARANGRKGGRPVTPRMKAEG